MIIAQLATIPEREPILKQVIDSLVPQVDKLIVMLNGHTEIPRIYTDDIIDVSTILSKEYLHGPILFIQRYNLLADAEKFYNIENAKDSYIFTCDDDLIYPPDYVETMIAKVEQYKRKAIITCHGRTFRPRPIVSYYKAKRESFHCLRTVEKDVKVDSGGTGVMCWHTDTVKVQYDWFKKPNMADIFMSWEMHKRNIPIMCIEHKAGWIQYLEPEQYGKTIWDKSHDDDKEHTKIYNYGC